VEDRAVIFAANVISAAADIRSVWEDICIRIRKGKERRQFIFTMHNSSLAVASDSDKFLIVEGSADKGRVVFSGSMDHQPLSDEVLTNNS
jgi:hypothetical protein